MRGHQCVFIQYVYLLGVGGMGMSGIARWFLANNTQVFGYDSTQTALIDQLVKEGIDVHFTKDPKDIPSEIRDDPDQSLVIFSPAIPKDHPLLQYFIQRDYHTCERVEAIRMITSEYKTVAVAGTHGKTTTTALIAHILYQAKKNVLAFVGGIMKNYGTNLLMRGEDQEDAVVVIEADEYDRFFLRLQPNIGIVTSMDADHLDIYENEQQYREAFKAFTQLIPKSGHLIMHREVAKQLDMDRSGLPKVHTYALKDEVIHAKNLHARPHAFCFDYVSDILSIDNIRLQTPGYFNVENALAAVKVCLLLGVKPRAILEHLNTFQGVERRFEYVLNHESCVFVSDYAHHPVEIANALESLRTIYPNKAITVVFQPHLYTRTRDLASAFAQALDAADRVYLLDIYPAREAPIQGVTTALIAKHMKCKEKIGCTKETLIKQLAQRPKPEVLVTMGAGDIHDLVQPICKFLKA